MIGEEGLSNFTGSSSLAVILEQMEVDLDNDEIEIADRIKPHLGSLLTRGVNQRVEFLAKKLMDAYTRGRSSSIPTGRILVGSPIFVALDE